MRTYLCLIVNELLIINKVSTPYWIIHPAVKFWNTDCRIAIHHYGEMSSYCFSCYLWDIIRDKIMRISDVSKSIFRYQLTDATRDRM